MQAILDKMNATELATLNRTQSYNQSRQRQFDGKPSVIVKQKCYFCKELGNGKEKTHNTRHCFLRQKNKNLQSSNNQTSSEDEEEEDDLSSQLQRMSSNQN